MGKNDDIITASNRNTVAAAEDDDDQSMASYNDRKQQQPGCEEERSPLLRPPSTVQEGEGEERNSHNKLGEALLHNNNNHHHHHHHHHHHIEHVEAFPHPKKRWLVLLFFCLLNLSNNFQWITFATIVDPVKRYFDCSSFEVDSLAWIYSALYVVLALPTCGIYDKFGLRNGMILGAALNATGSILKLITVYAYPSFGLLFFAQLFNAVAQCFTLGLPPMVAAAWFGTDERSTATSLAAVANILGAALGFPVPPAIVSTAADTSHSTLRHQFGVLFSFEMCLCVFTLIGVIAIVQDCPKNSPSVTARRRTEPVQQIPTILALLRNRTFVLLAVVMGFANGMFGGLATLLAQVNKPFGITSSETGWIGCVGSFASIIGSVAVGKLIDKMRRYKLPLTLLNFSITVCISATVIAYSMNSAPLANAYTWFTLLQILESCVGAVVFEYSVELTYPIPEAFSGTALMVLPNLFNFVIVLSSSQLLGDDPSPESALNCLAICAVVAFASGLACLFLNENLKRVTKEHEEGEVAGAHVVIDKESGSDDDEG